MFVTALTRRETLHWLAASFGAAGLGIEIARAQNTATAAVGDGAPLTDLGMEISAHQRGIGREFLKRHASVDIHCHPGRFFLKGVTDPSPTTRAFGEPFEAAA